MLTQIRLLPQPRRWGCLGVLTLVLGPLLALFAAAQAAKVWHLQTVDTAGNGGDFTSLALASSSYPVIS